MESLGGFAPSPVSTPRPRSPMQRPNPPANSPATADSGDAPAASGAEPSPLSSASKSLGLDREVQSVVSGFSSLWGSLKKQGSAALQTAEKQYESARADLSPLLSQARANLDHLGEQTRAEIQRLSEVPATSGQGVVIGADGMPVIIDDGPTPPINPGKGKGVDRTGDAEGAPALPADHPQQTPAAAASAFFASLAKNPNVRELSRSLSTLQTGVSRNLHQLQEQFSHLDLAEGTKAAEDYLHKGEHWFQEFSAEVSKLAADAVKVVPPVPSAGSASSGSTRSPGLKTGAASALSRRELVLLKLRTDTALLLADPSALPETRDSYAAFAAAREALDREALQAGIARELEAGGKALEGTRDELVPVQLDEESFWTRYFWRKQAIEAEEERRKQVLQSAEQTDDDFSWDMDDEDGASAAATSPRPSAVANMSPIVPDGPASTSSDAAAVSSAEVVTPAPTPADAAAPRASIDTPTPDSEVAARGSSVPTAAADQQESPALSTERSPRASSDGAGSYDVVDAKSGNPSGDELPKATDKPRKDSVAGADEDEDSDWE